MGHLDDKTALILWFTQIGEDLCLQGRDGVIKFLQLSRNALVLDSSWELWSKREDGTDELLVVLDKSMKLKETMEFAYEEEETEGKMYQWCKGEGKSLLREDRV